MKKRGLATLTIILIVIAVLVVGGIIYFYAGTDDAQLSAKYQKQLRERKGPTSKQVPSHLTCVSNACTLVIGEGKNDCSPQGSSCGNQTTNQTHFSCISNTCTIVQGAGNNECSTNADCAPGNETNQTHSICSGNSCIAVQGAGTNECLISSDCSGNNQTNVSLPDLTIFSMSYQIVNSTNGTFENKTVYVYTAVKNLGETIAAPSQLRLQLFPFGFIDTIAIGSLTPSQVHFNTKVYQNLPSGMFLSVNATADSTSQVPESNEFNNFGSVSFWT